MAIDDSINITNNYPEKYNNINLSLFIAFDEFQKNWMTHLINIVYNIYIISLYVYL